MWTDVKTIVGATGLSSRAVQIRVKKECQWRMKNGKQMEIYVPSLPKEWQEKVLSPGALLPADRRLPEVISRDAALVRKVAPSVLGKKATEAQKRRSEMLRQLKNRPAGTKKSEWIRSVSTLYGVSESTLYRLSGADQKFGDIGKVREVGKSTAFDPEAIEYIQGFWLQAIRESGECSKTTAWKQLQVMAKRKGWNIGSRSSAFNLLGEVDPLMVAFARGGNRALDNYFYITRDCDALQPMQIVIGDQHIFDWWVADYNQGIISRPECYLWLDMCTKLVYGIAFDRKYSSDTVKESLRLGLYRFGAFDCTYNDNGSSECSRAINSIVDDLIQLQMDARDVSDLYKTPEGIYVVVNEEGEVLDSARSPEEWRRKHRRIFANVKNAKAKDIERFFRTLEGRLSARLLPGRVATPGAVAAVDEVERKRLEGQKARGELLTIEQFMLVVLEELDAYEQEFHSTLQMTPREKILQKVASGWKPKYYEHEVVDLVLFDRVKRKVERGRVLIDNTWFIGEELASRSGRLSDAGLWKHDGSTVEVRYNRHDLSHAYAIVDGAIKPLKAVTSVTMLDDEAMTEAISAKRRQMAAVREAFGRLTAPIEGLTMKSDIAPKVRAAQKAQKALPETTDINLPEEVARRVESATTRNILPFHTSDHDRYRWCQDMIIAGRIDDLSASDRTFIRRYEASDDYKAAENYWENYRKLGGNA